MLIVIHYSEIALKGGNRRMFEEKLVENIKKSLVAQGIVFSYVKRISGRILLGLEENLEAVKIKQVLERIFGIAYFAFVWQSGQGIKEISDKAVEILQDKKFKSFCVSAKRSDKNFSLNSQQINEQVGEAILNSRNKGIEVDLENPDLILFIEVVEKYCFLYTEKIAGLGGLPIGVSGKAVCLISGGIDSPVAAFLCLKRGIEVVFLHFHSYPYTDKASIDKVKDLVSSLARFQLNCKIYLAPFADIQKEILLKTKGDLRVILYRRFMFRIAEKIAVKEKALALITGENIGQVASQTLPNLLAIEEAINILALRPLISEDKIDIIKKAKQIGTFEISIQPHQDCCSRFLPEHPETKADIPEVIKEEKKLDVAKLVKDSVDNIEIKIIS